MTEPQINVAGMPEFDAMLDHIYEYGTASEGIIDRANAFARAIIAQARAEMRAEMEAKPAGYLIDWPGEPDLGHYYAEYPSRSGCCLPLAIIPKE